MLTKAVVCVVINRPWFGPVLSLGDFVTDIYVTLIVGIMAVRWS